MNRNIILAASLLVFVAGCVGTQPVSVDANRGLTINEFAASSQQVRSGELVVFDAEVQNVGGTTARNAVIELLGVEGQWRDLFGNVVQDTQRRTLGTLKPPLPERNIAGDTKLEQWQLMTPEIPQGISPTLSIEARVTYDYNTSGHLSVGALSEDEFRRRQIAQQDLGQPAQIVNSPGPIHLDIPERFRAPIIVDTTSEERFETHPFRFEFVNVGDGFPVTPEDSGAIIGAGGKLTGTIDLLGPGVEFEDCLGQQGGTRINLDDSEVVVRLRDTGRVPVACTISIDKNIWASRPSDTIQFVFNIFYKYFVRQSAAVNVIGQR